MHWAGVDNEKKKYATNIQSLAEYIWMRFARLQHYDSLVKPSQDYDKQLHSVSFHKRWPKTPFDLCVTLLWLMTVCFFSVSAKTKCTNSGHCHFRVVSLHKVSRSPQMAKRVEVTRIRRDKQWKFPTSITNRLVTLAISGAVGIIFSSSIFWPNLIPTSYILHNHHLAVIWFICINALACSKREKW